MSGKSEQQKTEDAGRVKVEDLPQQEEKLSDKEARQIKGVGGARGGIMDKTQPPTNNPLVN